MSLSRAHSPASENDAAPASAPAMEAPEQTNRQPAGNAAAAARIKGGGSSGAPEGRGPTKKPGIDGALAAAFGTPVEGLEAAFGQDADNKAINARASTRGRKMSFRSDVQMDGKDGEAMEILGHEVAHALAGGGSGKTPVDMPGDRGESAADAAGKGFRRWAEQGFEGPAPALRPATGGDAAVHRYATSASAISGSPSLRNGSRGDAVKTLQYVLNTAHGERLSVDGIFGRYTEAAVIRYQRAHGLASDGVVGPITARALQGGASSGSGSSGSGSSTAQLTGSPSLKIGSGGSLVRTLQSMLNTYGARLTVDGDFGPVTQAAVMAFQRANGLTVDGVVGPQTAGCLTGGHARSVTSSSSGSSGSTGGDTGPEPESVTEWRERLLTAAATHLGALYWYGADGPTYFDCSGFVLYVMRQDTNLMSWGDDTAHGIMNRLPSTNNPEKGDLVFFWSGGSVEHVEMVTGNGSGTIGAGGGGRTTRGDNPNAKVKWDTWSSDSRSHTFGSVRGLIDAKLR